MKLDRYFVVHYLQEANPMSLSRIAAVAALCISFSLSTSVAAQGRPLVERGEDGRHGPDSSDAYAHLRAQAQEKGSVRVIIGIKPDSEIRAGYAAQPEADAAQRARIARVQEPVVASIRSALRGQSSFDITQFDFIPFLAVDATPEALERLYADPDVESIAEEMHATDALVESVPQIQADWALNQGYSGSGQTIAIIGTGVDAGNPSQNPADHPMLAGKLVSAACYSSSPAGTPALCSGGNNSPSVAIDSAAPCPSTFFNCDHETHVAGVALGLTKTVGAETFSGVARGSNLIAIQVASVVSTGQASSRTIREADVIAALNRVYALRGTYSIAAANLSNTFLSTATGTTVQYSSFCDADFAALGSIVSQLKLANIAVISASGNTQQPSPGKSYAPACLTDVISVGAVTKSTAPSGEIIATYSSTNDTVDLLAPGGSVLADLKELQILASTARGYPAPSSTVLHPSSNDYIYRTGTSGAAPHVAGAVAILKGTFPTATVDAKLHQLRATGASISGFPRVALQDAHQTVLSTPGTPASGSMVSQCGAVDLTWAASSGTVTHYELQGASSGAFTGATLRYSGSETEVAVGIAANTYFRVRGCQGLSCSGWKVMPGYAAYPNCA